MSARSSPAGGAPSAVAPPTRRQLGLLAADLARERSRLPRDYLLGAIPWDSWAELVSLLQCRPHFRDEGEAPLPCPDEPGTPGKVRELRRRLRAGLALFSPRDRQLAGGAAGAARVVVAVAEELARLRHA